MISYMYKNILIYGSDNRREYAAFLLILLAIFALTVWGDPV